MRETTYWNGEQCHARRVRVIVGPCEKETFWHNGLEGSEREAVEVEAQGQTFYLDNDNSPESYTDRAWLAGEGWEKVTRGRGSPQYPHASLPVAEVLGGSVELEIARMFPDRGPPPKREDYPSRQAFRHAQMQRQKGRG